MAIDSYTVYLDSRPLRIAFLLDTRRLDWKHLTAIMAYNRGKWGARLNPLILFADELPESWWTFLETFDPDVILSLDRLDDALLRHIDTRLSPVLVEHLLRRPTEENFFHVTHSLDGLSILPTIRNAAQIVRPLAGQPYFLGFEPEKDADQDIRRFVDVTFGTHVSLMDVQRALASYDSRIFRINDYASLATALEQVVTYRSATTYMSQIATLPNLLPDFERDVGGDHFTVVVGDSFADAVYFWNRPLYRSRWARTRFNEIFVPTALLGNAALREPLSTWLRAAADPSGTRTASIEYVSASLSDEELNQLLAPLLPLVPLIPRVAQVPLPEALRARLSRPAGATSRDFYHASMARQHFVLAEPQVEEGVMGGEHWVADLCLEFPDPADRHHRRNFWWQLTWRHSPHPEMFSGPSRVQRSGFPSVIMTRGEPRLQIRISNPATIFSWLLCSRRPPPLTIDDRHGLQREGFRNLRTSDKGSYLRGLLDVFGSLSAASHILGERYWRRMFLLLSRADPDSDAGRLPAIQAKLRKLAPQPTFTSQYERFLTSAAEHVLQLAKEIGREGRELPYDDFRQEAEKELDDFNKREGAQGLPPWAFAQDDLRRAMARLTRARILLMGVRPRCPGCGSAYWYHVDEAAQIIRCRGCEREHALNPQEDWFYRLNTLVQAGCVNHGLIPVVLALGQLLFQARYSFLFHPSVELFDGDEPRPFGEVDALCLVDGQFWIGEIKQSNGLFRAADFDRMAEIAARVRPDVVFFASMDRQPTPAITTSLESVRARLAALRIDVCWLQLDEHLFAASPVR